jgi:hypothetical protein
MSDAPWQVVCAEMAQDEGYRRAGRTRQSPFGEAGRTSGKQSVSGLL